jgi:ATP-binding cassette, subfamily C, bacterial LapB
MSDTAPQKNVPHEMVQQIEARLGAQAAIAQTTTETEHFTDPLVLAIADIASHYGLACSIEGLSGGLPLVRGRLPLAHVAMACERAGLTAEIQVRSVKTLAAHDCPVVLPMKNGSIVIATGVEGTGADRHIVVEIPGSSHPARAVPADGLERVASGEILRLQPVTVTVDQLPVSETTTARHWFTSAFKGTRISYVHVTLATIALNVLALALPLFTMNVYDRVIPNAAMDSLVALSVGALVAIIFDFIMRSLRADLVDISGRAVDVKLANSLFARLLGARINHKPGSTGVQANTLREFESLRDFFQSLTLTTFGDLPFAILFFVAIYLVAGPLVLVPALMVPVILIASFVIQRKLSTMMRDQFRDNAIRNAVAIEVLVGLETLKSLGAESWAAERWERATADGIRTSTAIRRMTNLATHVVVGSQSLVTVLMVLHGTHLVLAGTISTGALIAGIMLAGRALGPIGQIALLMTRAFQARQAFDALKPVLEAAQEREAGQAFVAKETIKGVLALDAVSFAYSEDTEKAVNSVSLNIRQGERVAILGTIGSGKSTLLKLFPSLITPDAGQVMVDGTSVKHLDPAVLRRHIAHVPQDAVLFRGSLRQNILIHAPRARDAELSEAVSVSGAAEWINRLPRGLDTVIGERGQGLSGGQRQSIALARALVTQPKVLLLDEPTGAMDGRSETSLLSRLATYVGRNRATLVIVTHRPAVLDITDRIIVMERGCKTHDGPKADVLAQLTGTKATAPTPRTAGVAS